MTTPQLDVGIKEVLGKALDTHKPANDNANAPQAKPAQKKKLG